MMARCMATLLQPSVEKPFPGALQGRPSERVSQMIERCYLRIANHEKVRLPTVRELAEQAGVSTATVQKVYRELTQQGRVITEVGNGTFLLPRHSETSRELVIALNIRPPSPTNVATEWHTRIYGGMLAESMRSGVAVKFRPLPTEPSGSEKVERALIDEIAEVDALALLFPSTNCKVIDAYRAAGRPVASVVAPSPQATANFVSPDFFGISQAVAAAMKDCGRRNFVLLLPSPARERISSAQWLAGLGNGFDLDSHPGISLRVLSAGGFEIGHGQRIMAEYLSQPGVEVDAVISSGDFLAIGAVHALKAAGLSVPGDVSVIGGSGLDLHNTPCPNLTRVRQPLEEIGARLFRMLVRLAREEINLLPGEYLPCSIIGGATTRDSENRALGMTASATNLQ